MKYITIRRGTKCKICKILIRPVVLYGSETWTLTKADEESSGHLKEEY
jgi:hypothetical protein